MGKAGEQNAIYDALVQIQTRRQFLSPHARSCYYLIKTSDCIA